MENEDDICPTAGCLVRLPGSRAALAMNPKHYASRHLLVNSPAPPMIAAFPHGTG
jgi:hypothetical protein